MKITKNFLRYCLGYSYDKRSQTFFRSAINTHYPFNHLNFIVEKGKIKLQTGHTKYDCDSIIKLIASIYFAGVNDGKLYPIEKRFKK